MNAALLTFLLIAADPVPPEGIRPLGADGKPLNLDFESGTLQDWTATGTAFEGQPIKGDAVVARRKDMKSNHQGEYWIGTYEKNGDNPIGTLTSVEFKVTHPWASFLIGGGKGSGTRVEILHQGNVIHTAHGLDTENMHRVNVDLTKLQGEMIQIRLVDEATGAWGHINFDDFRFHAVEPKAAAIPAGPANAGLSPEKAAAAMTVPEGFTVSLFAGEPDVKQPIAFCFDDRGRLWVAEAYTYPKRIPFDGPLLPEKDRAKGDSIVVFEDTKGIGKFDKRTVVIEGLNLVSGLEYGFGGIFVGAAPYFMHIPIKDDKPAGEPTILLDGWGYEDTHETLNSFTWGPDGWLYGCHGVFTHSKVGKPGTSEKDRVPLNAGVWRWHPTRKVFEVFAHGTSNPWGLDYNEHGDFFVEACVIPHLFHIVQGGRYTRQAGQHFNPYTYIDIPTIADHLHYQGNQWNNADKARSSDLGGGHPHCGLMCYQGGAWPKEYHGQLFMGNIHGQRINMDTLKPKGSSYVASHGKDFLLANDPWARFVAMKYGPDGNVFVIDWYDAQACHNRDPEIWDRTNGRIYKVSYRGTKPVVNLDLQKCTDEELVKYQTHENEWYARHSRRILQERIATIAEFPKEKIRQLCRQLIKESNNVTIQLRLLWLGFITETFKFSDYQVCLSPERDSHLKGWTATIFFQRFPDMEERTIPKADHDVMLYNWFVVSMIEEKELDDVILRHVLSNLPKLNNIPRTLALSDILESDVNIAQSDVVLRALFWYALESNHQIPREQFSTLENVIKSGDRQIIELFIRRILADRDEKSLWYLLGDIEDAENQNNTAFMLDCISENMSGWKLKALPRNWKTIYTKYYLSTDDKVKASALKLAVAFREPNALRMTREVLVDPKAKVEDREAALHSLFKAQDEELPAALIAAFGEKKLRMDLLKAMLTYSCDETVNCIRKNYSDFNSNEKRLAIAVMASKPAFAMALLDAIASKSIPATDVPAETIRQLRAFNDKALNDRVVAVWGTVRDTPADRKKLIAEWKKKSNMIIAPDLAAGRAVFAKTCQQCHTLYGVGGNVGPDITGSNRANIDYLLENIFDPSAVIPKEYMATTFDLNDGRKITGIVKEDGAQISLQTATEIVRFAATDVEKRKTSELSMMPDDLTKQMTEAELKNLISYLRNPQQVPMKATKENAKDFFNGKDLAGWEGDKDVWSVENGEIVGKTAKGLKKNTFLKSTLEAGDFKLAAKLKLVPNKGNSGIQFRSIPLDDGEMRGPQADVGEGWWGKLYEESGRGALVKEGGEKFIKKDDWNEYVIEAKGPTVKMWLNGNLVADYTDEKMAKRGIFGLQVHSGGPMEVRFKDLQLEVLP